MPDETTEIVVQDVLDALSDGYLNEIKRLRIDNAMLSAEIKALQKKS